MPRRPASVTQAAITRALRAVRAAGGGTVEVKPDGTILIIPAVMHSQPDRKVKLEPKREVVLW